MNLGVTLLAAPNAASSRVARYSLVARLAVSATHVFLHSVPGIDRCLLASATMRLASTANPSPPTKPAAMQASTTRSKTRRRSHGTAHDGHGRMLSDPEFCPQSRARKTSDRQGSLALRDTELAPSGSQTRSRRRASGPSAPDRSKAAQSSGKRAPAPSAPKKGRELQQSLEPGDRQERLHQDEMNRKLAWS